ncbi:acetyl-CoA carboxylase biotin carboxyl carrier protein [Companilactobacillus farciminis]|uniref:acetyl-CoA carboxylase biotin carboxyl carrier protein n=1 Tax=Companilactobacillus farciminis TaxID=1612 RepID=UPI00232CCD60|nr:biotin/lipoyl-containing protein [Companilactobacillus farciminis]WCG35125.1 acetyl-CoA carboxylase biotin carboxyl carrier protein subunit [Companilactobacillus farciminis]
MELDKVQKMIELMNEAGLSHLEIDDKEGHIVLERNITSSENVVPQQMTSPKPTSEEKTITAPFVGTFYSSEQPDKAPLVKLGDKVTKGQSIAIIEAMKMMNEVKADKDGVVDKILVSNGDQVEYDQPLFMLK